MSAIREGIVDWVPADLESMGRYFPTSIYSNFYGKVAPSRSICLHPCHCAGIVIPTELVSCIHLSCIDKASFMDSYITESTPPWASKLGPILPCALPNQNLSS